MNEKIKLMLVEDSHEYRHVIQFAFQDDQEIELVDIFGTAELALRSLGNPSSRTVPDVILLDLNLPGISGLDALPELSKLTPESKILILTQSESEADVLSAIRSGASGYLLKSSSVQELRSGIQTVMDGGASVDPRMALYLLNSFKREPVTLDKDITLSERELEILSLISEGLARKEIAEKLEISPKTVANHIAHIFEKLNVPNSPAAINKAHRMGILGSDD
ncbi:MAG: response regulator transcription factor [Akkermansiaceae bacterium]|jgi:DNA-binding NarL/FixJ family response regulator|nr:response regulator transcription factor [Akkermansiaceae bacterium]MDB4465175.1 response regulator transcription factor [Akkermansiaceae bacterium]MDB4541752.1 response regulator transcription factor [bacterium]MDF1714589.1 response regulator transcription factor [Akkermansiaceae bacterium]